VDAHQLDSGGTRVGLCFRPRPYRRGSSDTTPMRLAPSATGDSVRRLLEAHQAVAVQIGEKDRNAQHDLRRIPTDASEPRSLHGSQLRRGGGASRSVLPAAQEGGASLAGPLGDWAASLRGRRHGSLERDRIQRERSDHGLPKRPSQPAHLWVDVARSQGRALRV